MMLLSIDPGPTHSAWMVLDGGEPSVWGKDLNNEVLRWMRHEFKPFASCEHLAIERVESFGMAVGAEVFSTCEWTGRFIEAVDSRGWNWTAVTRKEVKMHLCHSMRAKDTNIRAALIDKFGGKDAAIGRKASKGPLYGISGDCWSCLAIGNVWFETNGAVIV